MSIWTTAQPSALSFHSEIIAMAQCNNNTYFEFKSDVSRVLMHISKCSVNASPLIPFFLMLSFAQTSKGIHSSWQYPTSTYVSNDLWNVWIQIRLTFIAICSVLGAILGSWPIQHPTFYEKRKPRLKSQVNTFSIRQTAFGTSRL